VLDGVHMVQTGRIEEPLEVVCQWSHLAFGNVFGGCNILLIGVVCFLIIIIVTVGINYNPPRAPFSPSFFSLGALLGPLIDDIGWRCPADAGDHFPIVWDKDGLSPLLARGVLGSDVKQLLAGVCDDVVRCLEALQEPHAVHATFKLLWAQSLRTEVASHMTVVSILT
jgi:hypothetical protein